jgi:2-methylcitrate dehydratase PrpD
LGALLAMADLRGGISGKEALLAATLGLDVSSRIALAATVDRGWHRTAAIGIFGATAVAGKLLGLTAEQLHHAFGIAYSQAAGNRQCIVDGSLTKRYQAGQAASGGIFSALLAREGFTGASEIFTGRFGFYELYQPGGYDLAPLTAELGTAFRGDMLSFKPYPCGRPQHAMLDAALALHRPGVEIAEVVVRTDAKTIANEIAPPHKRKPSQIVEAQFALPFLIAACLVHGRLGIDEVGNFNDPAVLALAAKVRAEEGTPSITLHRADGGTAAQAVRNPARGAPANPMTDAERALKFGDCAAHAVRPIAPETVDRAISVFETLPDLPDITSLTKMF